MESQSQRINNILLLKLPEEKGTRYLDAANLILDRLKKYGDHVALTSVGFKQPNALVLGFDLDIIDIDKFSRNEATIGIKIREILHMKTSPVILDIALTMFRVEIIDCVARFIFNMGSKDEYLDQEQFDELAEFLSSLE